MTNLLKALGLVVVGAVVGALVAVPFSGKLTPAPTSGVYNAVTNFFAEGISVGKTGQFTVSSGGAVVAATSTVESFTQGGRNCTLTDATGGAYTLTDAEMATCGVFEFAAGGAGQAAIALTFPATSTMTLTVPSSGDCRTWLYDASALAAATTTTMTLGTGHNVIAYTTNDDVIDGAEFAQIQMCRKSNTDVNTIVTELLNAD